MNDLVLNNTLSTILIDFFSESEQLISFNFVNPVAKKSISFSSFNVQEAKVGR